MIKLNNEKRITKNETFFVLIKIGLNNIEKTDFVILLFRIMMFNFLRDGDHQCLSKMKFIFYLNCYLTRLITNFKTDHAPPNDAFLTRTISLYVCALCTVKPTKWKKNWTSFCTSGPNMGVSLKIRNHGSRQIWKSPTCTRPHTRHSKIFQIEKIFHILYPWLVNLVSKLYST